MVQKISIYQYKSKMRQAVNKYNSDVRRYNNEIQRGINKYNQEVRRYNSQVRANRQQLTRALNSFKNSSHSTRISIQSYTGLHRSVQILNTSYQQLETKIINQDNYDTKLFLDLPQQENTNSLMLYNSLIGNDEDDGQSELDLKRTVIEEQLHQTDEDLGSRWKGAIYSLNPYNPDATRHFCTSVREIFIKILDIKAPDNDVIDYLPDCQYTDKGNPTRRSKIKYILNKRAIHENSFEDFVEDDIDNILQLFRSLNEGTHGHAGKFEIPQLLKLKKRVEDSIIFIINISK